MSHRRSSQEDADQNPQGETWSAFLRSTSGPSSVARPFTTRSPHDQDRPSAAATNHSSSRKRVRSSSSGINPRRTHPMSVAFSPRQRHSGTFANPLDLRSSPTIERRSGSYANPIDLTSPTRRRAQTSRLETHRQGRQEGSPAWVLPPWQSDDEVIRCPVCEAPFTFWFRKHHCRKCGQVVCANCSQHRITIPRPFVVRPPTTSGGAGEDSVAGVLSSILGSQLDSATADPTSNDAGGEIVRVCNPCVPDPNYSPPPQQSPQGYGQGVSPPARIPGNSTSTFPASSQSSGRAFTLRHGHRSSIETGQSSDIRSTSPEDLSLSSRSGRSHRPVQVHRAPQLSLASSLPLPSERVAVPTPSTAPAPTRIIAEEDQCPVCLRELPPFDPENGSDQARTDHIANCIESSELNSSPSSAARPLRGMVRYRASEKDCINVGEDGDGIPKSAECIICFEEFEIGEGLARLQCLCRFHEHCIREWWRHSGPGSCPTHQPTAVP